MLVESLLLQLRRLLIVFTHLLSLLIESLCSIVVVQGAQRCIFGLSFEATLVEIAVILAVWAMATFVLLIGTRLFFDTFLCVFGCLILQAEVAILSRLDLIAIIAILLLISCETHRPVVIMKLTEYIKMGCYRKLFALAKLRKCLLLILGMY